LRYPHAEFFGNLDLFEEVAEWIDDMPARDEAFRAALERCYVSPAAERARRGG
jgi:hypothetical protein